MKIEKPIHPKTIANLLNSTNERIIVPRYQRRFSWNETHFKDLWNDLKRIEGGEQHFFGTMVFMSKTHIAQGINEIEVVDGQQRITTISILLCVLRDYLKKEFGKKVNTRIKKIDEKLWLIDRDGKRQGMRLVLGNLDKESYENVVESNLDDIENQHIKEAYEYFYDKLKPLKDINRIKELHDKLLDQLLYVSITVGSHTDAFRLFESMNNRGLSLSPIDLMKNYLLMRASERNELDDDKIEKMWGDIIQNLDKLDIHNPAITFFRHYFMSSPLLDINEKITKSKLYEPSFTEAIDNSNDVENLIEDIRKHSNLYEKMLNQRIDMFSNSENIEINKLLYDAKIVSITSFTLFLRAFRELSKVKEIKEVIRKSNALLIRRQICDKSTGRHDTFFNHLAKNAFKEKNPLKYIEKYLKSEGRCPRDEQFKRHFAEEYFPRNDRTKYVLSKIEEEHFGHGGKQVVGSRYEVHIEHILPEMYGKNLKKNWLKPFNISKDEHEDYKKKIGNLTLLEDDLNIRASNRTFKEKKKYYTEEETDFVMTQQLVDYDEWGIHEIEERSNKLSEIACKVWNL